MDPFLKGRAVKAMRKRSKKKVIILGTHLHAGSVLELVELSKKYTPVGYIDNDKKLLGKIIRGLPVIGTDEMIPKLKTMGISAAAFGFGHDFIDRIRRLISILRHFHIELPNFIHPSAVISDSVRMGFGNVVMAGAVINSYCMLGDACVINTNCSIDHNCVLDDHVFISPGVAVGGWVKIKERTFVGIGSCVIDRLKIGKKSFIGAGSVVVHDVPDNVLVYGNPAKVIRKIKYVKLSDPHN